MKGNLILRGIALLVCLFIVNAGYAAVQYSNNFDNPADKSPSKAWTEWVDMSTDGPVYAQNGRIEWTGSGNHWLRLNKALPLEYVVEFDFFYQNDTGWTFFLLAVGRR